MGTVISMWARALDSAGGIVGETGVAVRFCGAGFSIDAPVMFRSLRTATITQVAIHKERRAPAIVVAELSPPAFVVPGGSYRLFHLCVETGRLNPEALVVASAHYTLEDFTADHPNATQQEVWGAAFIAGHQTAFTLLTGEI